MMWKYLLASIGGIGCLLVLIGTIWRLLRSREYISESEYLYMRLVFLSGFVLMMLTAVLFRKIM